MKKKTSKILSFGIALSILLGTLINPMAAENINIDVIETPKIDITLTSKDTNLDLTNFESDLTNKLKQIGIDTSNINFTKTKSNTSIPQNSFVWEENTNISKILTSIQKGSNYIYMKGNQGSTRDEVGQGVFVYFPQAKSYNDTITFNYDMNFGDSFTGGGVILKAYKENNILHCYGLSFNTTSTNWGTNAENTAATWMYLNSGKKTGALWKMTIDMNTHTLGTYELVQGFNVNQKGTLTAEVTREQIKITGGGMSTPIVANVESDFYNANGLGYFGVTYYHGCSSIGQFNLTNIHLNQEVYLAYKEILTQPTWREDAKHVIVNVDNNTDDTLTSSSTIGEILSRTLADDIHFIQWGTDTNKSATTNFIKQNDNKGLFTYNNNYEQALNDTANYIKSLVRQQESEEQIITIGQEINLLVTPEKFKTNATSDEYPNGRWKINHEYKHFANNLGQSTVAGVYSPNLNCNFDKPGKYEITFDDEVVKTIYVHRKPVADFEININNLAIDLQSVSYDLDSNINNGIASEKWYYKETSASNWTEGKLTQLDKTKIYVIKLEVEDFQGATNYTTKYVGTGNPVSNFNFANSTICKYNQLEINNTSYDPVGYDITTESWELRKDGQLIGTYSTPILDFNTSNLGPANYTYTLVVTNSQGTKSEAYTKSFTVVDDVAKPEITIETETTNEWLPEKDVEVEVSDNESNVAKWRYEFVTSPTPTKEDTDWSAWDTENTKVTVNSGALSGRYYLHIQAYDSANNLTERTVGPFNLDNSNPVINGVEVEKQGFRETKVTVNAFDEHSGIVGYALTKYETATFSMRTRTFAAPEMPEFQESNEFMVDEDGLYTVWAIDALGNVETSVCEVTNSNQTDKTTTVYAEIGSEFKVTIPKKIVLDGATKSGTYQVTVEGDIAGLEVISVTPDSAVTLSSKDKADVIGTITQDKLNWTYSEIYTDSKILANGSISASGITAGAWNGTFNFAIKLENNGKYTNSEWSVEYQDITFDMEELDNTEVTEPTE